MKSQKQRVVERIEEVGYVDNFWAFHNYILRLGAIIHSLKRDGWNFDADYRDGKNYVYKPTIMPARTLFD